MAAHQCGWSHSTVAVLTSPPQCGWFLSGKLGVEAEIAVSYIGGNCMLTLERRPYQRACKQPLERDRDEVIVLWILVVVANQDTLWSASRHQRAGERIGCRVQGAGCVGERRPRRC